MTEAEDPRKKARQLVNKSISPFMKETDPKNPYGPNFEDLPMETKIYYKYTAIKKFVHFTEPDQKKLLNANLMYIGGKNSNSLNLL